MSVIFTQFVFCLLLLFMHLFVYLFFYFLLFRAAPAAYGSFQAWGWVRATAAGLSHSSQQHWILNSLSKTRDLTHILMVTRWVHYHWVTIGIPHSYFCFLNLCIFPHALACSLQLYSQYPRHGNHPNVHWQTIGLGRCGIYTQWNTT